LKLIQKLVEHGRGATLRLQEILVTQISISGK